MISAKESRINVPKENIINQLLHIPIKSLAPSKINPRKHFDEQKLKDLTESVKEKESSSRSWSGR